MKKIDLNSSLLKVIASFFVILSHIPKIPPFYGENVNIIPIQFNISVSIAIAIFFIIPGFFIYNGKDTINNWKNQIVKYFKNIFIPFLFIIFFALIIFSKISPINSISLIFNSIIKMSNEPFGFIGGHTWFIYSYFYIILFYPITHYIIKRTSDKEKIFISLIIIFFMFIKDIISFKSIISDNSYQYVIYPVIYSFLGHVLYHVILKSKSFHKKNIGFTLPIFLVSYILINIIMYKYHTISRSTFLYYESWISLVVLLSALSFITFLYSAKLIKDGYGFKINKKYSYKLSLITYQISKNNLYIYLIHPYILVLLSFTSFKELNLFLASNPITCFIWFVFLGIVITLVILIPRLGFLSLKNHFFKNSF